MISFSSQINSISAVLVYLVAYSVIIAQGLHCFGVPIVGGYQQRSHAVLACLVYVCAPEMRFSLGRVIGRTVHYYI